MDTLPAPNLDARCPRHDDSPAIFVCRRCGAFGCQTCRADPVAGLCAECVARQEAERGPPAATVAETLSHAFRLPLKCPRASLFFIAVALTPGLLWALWMDTLFPGRRDDLDFARFIERGVLPDYELVRQSLMNHLPFLGAAAAVQFVSLLAELLGAGVLVLSFMASLEGRTEPLRSSLSLTARRFAPLVLVNVVMRLGGYVGMLFCVLPGIAFMALGVFIDPLVLRSGSGPFSAISTSIRMTLKVLGPVVVLVILTNALGFACALPLGLLRGVVVSVPLLGHLLEVAGDGLELILGLPTIAASAYLFFRSEAGRARQA